MVWLSRTGSLQGGTGSSGDQGGSASWPLTQTLARPLGSGMYSTPPKNVLGMNYGVVNWSRLMGWNRLWRGVMGWSCHWTLARGQVNV